MTRNLQIDGKSQSQFSPHLSDRAEEKLPTTPILDPANLSPAETVRLLHELRVHQVELEAQNEELLSSQIELEKSRDSYSELFEFSPCGYLTLDSEFRVTKANSASMELLQEGGRRLLGCTFSRFINSADADKLYFHFQSARLTGLTQKVEIRLALPQKKTLKVQLHTILLHSGKEKLETFLVAVFDISAQEEAKAVIQQANEALEIRVRERTYDLEVANRTLTSNELELRKLSSAVQQSQSSISITDLNGFIEYVNPHFTKLSGFTLDELRGTKPNILKLKLTSDEIYRKMWATISSGHEWRGTRQNRAKDGNYYWEESCISPIKTERGEISHYLCVGEDITERKEFQERQQLLMFELDHRVKNTLSVVIAIAKQTMQTTRDLSEFRQAFEGRLMALAEIHRLLTKNCWKTVLLSDLINLASKPYVGASGPTIIIEGPPLRLGPKDAQSIHLIFHELSTNASKYGAFSTPGGCIHVSWELKQIEKITHVKLCWIETGGPRIEAASKMSFGHRLIERTIVNGLGGNLSLLFPESGFKLDAVFPCPEVTTPVESIARKFNPSAEQDFLNGKEE